ncbi:hypothetical protein BH11BAC2_BH11BAC2_07610 [soil metagenome]
MMDGFSNFVTLGLKMICQINSTTHILHRIGYLTVNYHVCQTSGQLFKLLLQFTLLARPLV